MNVGEIGRRALQQLKVIAAGETPTAAETSDLVSAYNGLIASLRGHGVGPALRPMLAHCGYARIGGLHSDAALVTPENPFDGARFGVTGACTVTAGDDVTIEDGAVTGPTVWFYRADLAQWINEAVAVSADEPQFPTELHEGLASMLALRLPEYGADPSPALMALADEAMSRLVSRYRPRINPGCDTGVLYGSRQPWNRWFR